MPNRQSVNAVGGRLSPWLNRRVRKQHYLQISGRKRKTQV